MGDGEKWKHVRVPLDDFKRRVREKRSEGSGALPPPVISRLVDWAMIGSNELLLHDTRADWAGVDPRIRAFAGKLVQKFRGWGVPLVAIEARRTVLRQRQLYDDGKSKVSGPVAAHTVGGAVDIVHAGFWWNMSRDEWAYIGAVGRSVDPSLTWGGSWSFYDPAHWECPEWKAWDPIPPEWARVEMTPTQLARSR